MILAEIGWQAYDLSIVVVCLVVAEHRSKVLAFSGL